jgi:hypothetical protein
MVREEGFEPPLFFVPNEVPYQARRFPDYTGEGTKSRTWACGFGDRRATVTLYQHWVRTHESNMALLLMRQEWSPDHLTAINCVRSHDLTQLLL